MLREKRKQIGKETGNNHEQRNFYHIGRPGRRRKNNADSDDEGTEESVQNWFTKVYGATMRG